MDGGIAIILISAFMFSGCFLFGLIPLLINFSEQKLLFVSLLGAGLLCGTALAVVIPEGVDLLEESWRATSCSNVPANQNATNGSLTLELASGKGLPATFFIGVSLVIGFIFMFVVDQINSYCALQHPRTGVSGRSSITATLGLIIHAAVDGVALGTVVASSQVTVQLIVVFAVMLHKAPAAFGLVSFLMHAGFEKKEIKKHLLAFSAAAPLLAISTYFILSTLSGSSQHLCATGVGMLFSAGTFLYVATVHVLPEISSRGQHGSSQLYHNAETGAYKNGWLGLLESFTLIIGALLPVLLTLGLPND